jgi:CheY-like chemotaxis protein
MESFSELIDTLSSLAWPIIFGIFVYKFYEPIRALIESVRGRRFTIKVAGNELTVEEASEQQRKIVNDVQSRLAEIERRLESTKSIPLRTERTGAPGSKSIFWVDDKPKNNSFLIAALRERGHVVDTALTTNEGIKKFKENSYDIVISDMGRPEDEKAGITLAKKIHSLRSGVPYFIFCGGWAARNLRDEALANGVTEITSSGTMLLSKLPLANDS